MKKIKRNQKKWNKKSPWMLFLAWMMTVLVISYQDFSYAYAAEVKSHGNIVVEGNSGETDCRFAVSDLQNLHDDLELCRETAETTRKPMVYALELKGVMLPETASYSEIASGILRIPDEYIWGLENPDGVTYDYHNHVNSADEKTNDSNNSAVYATSGGCYTTPVYHSHTGSTAASGGCYTAPVYHSHTGSAAAYGGCYTNPIYHHHTGSTAASGGCYTTPVYHSHTGNTAASGGCYTTPVYHSHTGSRESGGGCYTVPVYHTHTNCPSRTETCRYRQEFYYRVTTYDDECYWHSVTTHIEDMVKTYDHVCGEPDGNVRSARYCAQCNMLGYAEHTYTAYDCGAVEGVTIDYWELGCNKTEATVESYDLGCGKTTTSIESYDLGCGKTTSTVESYKTGCGKTTTTVESYAPGCGKTDRSIEGYSIGCNHIEGQIVAAHLVF